MKCGMKLLIPFPNFNSEPIEFGEWISNFISHFIMGVITYSCLELSYFMLVKIPLVVPGAKGSAGMVHVISREGQVTNR